MRNSAIIILSLTLMLSVFSNYGQVTPGDTIHAVNYVIELHEVDMGAQTITAKTTVRLTPLVDDLDMIQLQLMQLTVDSVFVDQQPVTANYAGEVLKVSLPSTISQGDTVEVTVYYHGQPFHENWGGFHYSGNYAFNLGVGIDWIPHNLGKSWFPCIDDFTDRATYDVKATVPDTLEAIGGGELVDIIDNGDGTHTFHWYIDNPIPTYLASIAIGDYELVSDTHAGVERDIPITYYVWPNDVPQVPGSFARIHEIIELFEDHFGPYDWHRIGYVETSKGAMEHATNIAYPNFCINGNSSYEDLYAHELSHMWFGDKVTCDKAEEMWINEGWATFCQHYYVEVLDGREDYKTAMRNLHASVLKSYHTTLGEYYPMNNIPQNHTYTSIASYDKGAATVQSLRAYLGDDVFFPACVAYLEDYAFQSVSSYDMEASFTQNTGVDMSGFFNNWIYNGGTPHYSIDSTKFTENKNMFDVGIYLKQKRHGPSFTGDGNIIEFTVLGKDWSMYTDTIMFDGETGHKTVSLDFEPAEVFLDLEEKYLDATVDNYMGFDETGEYTFPQTYFKAEVTAITDSLFIQATHNFSPPDSLNIPAQLSRISDFRYWTIRAAGNDPFSITGGFDYRIFGLDNTLILSPYDSLVILYRANAGMPWQIMEHTLDGTFAQGTLYVEDMPMGDYVLGVWDDVVSTGEDNAIPEKGVMEIFPNPSRGKVTFSIENNNASRLEIYSFDGRLQEILYIDPGTKSISWSPALTDGSYIAVLRAEDERVIDSQKLILCK